MSNTIKSFWLTFVTSLLIVLLGAQFALANHSWGGYHWARTTATFDLQVINSMGPEWQNSYDLALSDWSSSSVLNLVEAKGSTRRCRGKDGYIEACSDNYGGTGWLGLASIWASGGHITKGTAKMNDYYYNDSYAGGIYNTSEWRNLVTCQEIAHAFGLAHQDEGFNNPNLGTCMDYTNDPSTNQHPNQHDFDQLALIYGHTDSFDSYAASGGSDGGSNGKGNNGKGKPQNVGQDIDLNNPAEWGKAVAFDAAGNPSVYVRELGNDEQIITHVTWLEGYGDDDNDHIH